MNRFKNLTLSDLRAIPIFLISIFPALFFKLYLTLMKKSFWLICEENEAHDNGFVFFEFMQIEHPEITTLYAINKNSMDYEKVAERFSNAVIPYGSLKHWIYYFCAESNISSQKGGKPNAAICYVLEVFGLLKNHRVFLQHGVILNNTEFLHYNQTKFRLFITSAKPEFEYVKQEFGYPDDYVVYTGLARFDKLYQNVPNKKQILLMPSWRAWLKLNGKDSEELKQERANLAMSEYVRTYNELISNEKLLNYLEKNDIQLYFYPHRNAQPLLKYFKVESSNIKLCNHHDFDVQALLKESSLLITDYSSVSMDFIYMKKPVIFFQFDEKKFRENQYDASYFDYKKTSLGFYTEHVEDVVDKIISNTEMDFVLPNEFNLEYKQFFAFNDSNNCERIYHEILKSLGMK